MGGLAAKCTAIASQQVAIEQLDREQGKSHSGFYFVPAIQTAKEHDSLTAKHQGQSATSAPQSYKTCFIDTNSKGG